MSGRHIIKSDGLSWRAVGDEIVILDLTGLKYLALNGTGALLWTALEGGTDDEGLATLLAERFDVDPARAAQDVEAFLRDCVELGLIE